MAGEAPRHLHVKRGSVSQLSIFVDESGDFGTQSEFYVVSFVFHDQARDISAEVARLAEQLRLRGQNPEWAIHTGAAIRGEDVYRGMPLADRRREFTSLFAFARRVPVTYEAFTFRKKEHPGRIKLMGAIARALSAFLQNNTDYLLGFDHVVVYYDNGQAESTLMLNTLLNSVLLSCATARWRAVVTMVEFISKPSRPASTLTTSRSTAEIQLSPIQRQRGDGSMRRPALG